MTMKTSFKKHVILLSVILTASFNLNAQVPDFTKAAEKSINAVVHVKTKTEVKQRSIMGFDDDPFFQFFFGQPRMQQQQKTRPVMASGSGVIITEDGYIVTNNHVIADADEIEVTLNDKKTYTAKVIGSDPNTDIALLKIDAENLHTIPFGNSDDLKVGEWVLAIGNPFNLTSTVTAGIVSAKARNINILSSDMKIESFIQTDAAVNPGNSGGALVNLKGELVGINTAIATQTGSYTGYSFAITSNIAKKVVDDLKKYGEVQRAILGVSISDISDELAKEKKIKVMEGAYVHSVSDGSAAKAAGIKEGDIITKINDKRVNSVAELQEQIARKAPGDNVSVTVLRNDSEKTFTVELKNKRGNLEVMTANTLEELGASFQELGKDRLT
ncbi:MAG: Do family serine endopeptidase, partial [Paludibacteraceae bacterium]|nr:Do family serine endopeptidase [Paludibacteraceae bacterium]